MDFYFLVETHLKNTKMYYIRLPGSLSKLLCPRDVKVYAVHIHIYRPLGLRMLFATWPYFHWYIGLYNCTYTMFDWLAANPNCCIPGTDFRFIESQLLYYHHPNLWNFRFKGSLVHLRRVIFILLDHGGAGALLTDRESKPMYVTQGHSEPFVKIWYESIFHTCQQTKLNNIFVDEWTVCNHFVGYHISCWSVVLSN